MFGVPKFAIGRVILAAALAIAAALPVAAQDQPKKSSALPLKRVVMFNAGVGFFEHNAQIEGDATVELKFNTKDVNDLLKSMVLSDLGGGRISTVTYGSKDPITKALKTFAVDLTANPTLGQILGQLRGERVELDAPNAIAGVIVGVETRRKEVGKDHPPVEIEMLNLLTDEGLRSVQLDTVGRIRLADPKLDGELRQALAVLALGHSTDKKTVTLNFLGQGQRPVRVGYIQETPIWKTSYRLVLADDKPPFLQGWAIVENTTEEDWNNVDLTLVSGRPISFVMDLYQPLYVHRPIVEPELYASLRPQVYGQDLARANVEFEKLADAAPPAPAAEEAPLAARKARMAARGGAAFGGLAGGGKPGEGADAKVAFNLQQGGQSMAQASDVGELFQYVIATPVNLPRQQSAMLPIVNESIQGTKVSIYNAAVQVKHPLNGLRLKNTTELHLMQGPITVFDDGVYAGDARIEDLPPGTERLLSYALDLDTEVAPESVGRPEQLLSVKLFKGLMHTSHKYTRTQKYTVKNSGRQEKTVLVEYPLDANWKLVTPKEASEKTRNLYRFAVPAPPGKPANLEVTEEQTTTQQVAISNLDDNTIRFYLNQKVVGDKVKAALQEMVQRKVKIEQAAQQRQQMDQQIASISQEQERIRQNMAQLDRNTDLYKKYVKKFSDQEDQVEKLRDQIKKQQDEETGLRKALDDFLLGLDLS